MLVVGPNLSVDQTVGVPQLRVGTIHRVPTVLKLAGGKGANVARSLHILGADPVLIGFAGGPIGEQFVAYLSADGIAHRLVASTGETRICFSIADETTGEQTEFYEGGAPVGPDEVAALLAAVEDGMDGQRWVAITGSLPRGAPEDLYAHIVELAQRHGAHALLDARGSALAAGIAVRPHLLKINRTELSEYSGRTFDAPQAVADAAAQVVAGTLGAAIITLGAAGAVAVDASGRWLVTPPDVRVLSPVGSGDAAAAGALAALERGSTLPEAARLAVAAGTANALHLGAACFTHAEVESLLSGCTAQPLT